MCGVVDGDTVKLTPFRELIVPPPSSAFEVHVGSQVQQVVFPCAGEGDSMLAGASKDSNSMLAVTREMVFVFRVKENGLKDVTDLVKITGSGGNGFVVKSSLYSCVGQLPAESGLGLVSNLVWVGGYLVGSVATPAPAVMVYQECNGRLELVNIVACEELVYLLSPCPTGAVVQLLEG